ncbi:MAG: PPE family protein [Mycobacterium sp.]
MTAPIWMASPPEVHSALLSAGPGPGPLLAAAGAWASLSAEYSTAAAELTSILGAAQAGAWEGPSAAQYVAAHAPYLAWLTQAGVNSAMVAAQQQTAAAGYTSALAMMPTLGELAANHAVHGVLLATNFFGLNTIPIALNEADYVRMWIQAATAMTAYQAVAGSALASAPRTTPAPFVLTPGVGEAGSMLAAATQTGAQVQAAEAGSGNNIADFLADILRLYTDTINQLFEPLIDFFMDPIGNSIQLITDFLTNPAAALQTWGPFLFALAYQAISWIGASLTYPQLLLQPLLAIFLPILVELGKKLLELLNLLQLLLNLPPLETAVPPAPAAANQPSLPAAGISSSAPGSPGTAAPAPGAGTATVPSGSAAASAAAPAVPYAVQGIDPDPDPGPTLTEGDKARAPASDMAAVSSAAALAATQARRKARRRRGAEIKDRGFRDEYLTMDDGPAAPPAEPQQTTRPATAQSSQHGAGTLGAAGLTGTQAKPGAAAAGMTSLDGDSFGNGPTSPMLPNTWNLDQDGGEGESTEPPR